MTARGAGTAAVEVPGWIGPLAVAGGDAGSLPRARAGAAGFQHGAVLVALTGAELGSAAVALTERAHTMRRQPGHIAFPGGGSEPGDRDPVETALREAHEEVGIAAADVCVVGRFDRVRIGPARYDLTPVVGYLPAAPDLASFDPVEVHTARWVPLADLADPARRGLTRLRTGETGPAFALGDWFVWGFTAMVLDTVLARLGTARPDALPTWQVPDRLLRGRP